MKKIVFLSLLLSFGLRAEIYEIRDYTIEAEWFDEYVYWAENHFN